MEYGTDIAQIGDGVRSLAAGVADGISTLAGRAAASVKGGSGPGNGSGCGGPQPSASGAAYAGVCDGLKTISRAAIIGVAAGTALYGAWRLGPTIYRSWRRHVAVSRINDRSNWSAPKQEAYDTLKACVTGSLDEGEVYDTEPSTNPPPAQPPAGAGPNPAPAPPRLFINPYKGDSSRLRANRSFWVFLAASARARFGLLHATPANRAMVYQWCIREAQSLTATSRQPTGSIRADHLRRYVPLVVLSVFVKSEEDIALEAVESMLNDIGVLKTTEESW
nr:hypothetical protein [Tolivirales sp.]